MNKVKELKFKISYHGGDATDGKLEIYDAGVSIHGLARALAITTHAFANDGEIRKRAERAEGVTIYIHPSRKGSFEEFITIDLSNDTAQTIGLSIAASAFWDFLKWSWSAAIGKATEPATPFVKKLSEKKEPLIGELAIVLESPMEQLHRPIERTTDMQILISRPQVGEVLRLDSESLGYVTTRTESELVEDVLGNATKYNILSGYGRFFDDTFGKTVSFELDSDVSAEEKRLLTWSMDQRAQGLEGKLHIDITRVVTAKGEVKRYRVFAVRKAPIEG